MEFLNSLWMPILVSAAFVWIASFLSHMVLPIHKGEWKGLPNEDKVLEAMGGPPPGNYMFPWGTMADMKNPDFVEKQKRGPTGTAIIWPGPVNMGRNLILTFLSYALISLFAAYVCYHAFIGSARPDYLEVFRIAGTTAFMAHALGLLPQAIWYRGLRIWSVLLDGIIYAAITAGVFGWLWPK